MPLDSAEIAKKAVEAALDKQATDILMLDIRAVSYIADYFVLCSADSERQLQAICDAIEEALRETGIRRYRSEGTADTGWVLLDFGHVVVHVFSTPERAYYDIEGLWGSANQVVRIL